MAEKCAPAEEILLLDKNDRSQLWRATTEWIDQYIEGVEQLPVAPPLAPEHLRTFLAEFTFEHPLPPVAAMQKVAEAIKSNQVHTPHPSYFGLFNPAPTAMGIAADTLVAALNPQLAAWSHSPLAAEIEQYLVRALGEKFGYTRPDIDGTFASGGAEANQTAVICALVNLWPQVNADGVRSLPAAPVLYVSTEAHHSFLKAARVSGLGSTSVREVPVDARLRMRVEDLRTMIAADRAAGLAPFLIVGTVGTTGAGAIDPLVELAEVAREQSIWFHADAAWGGAAALVPELRPALAGLELADSITFDSHKWMSVPMGAGMFITRHRQALTHAFAIDTSYMPKEARHLGAVDPFMHSLQWSRRHIGLKLFLSLAVAGWDGYAAALRHQTEMGELLRHRLRDTGWQVLNDTPLPIVCFTHVDLEQDAGKHQALVDSVIASGEAWISTIRMGGTVPAIRACITNYRTQPRHVEKLVETMQRWRAVC